MPTPSVHAPAWLAQDVDAATSIRVAAGYAVSLTPRSADFLHSDCSRHVLPAAGSGRATPLDTEPGSVVQVVVGEIRDRWSAADGRAPGRRALATGHEPPVVISLRAAYA